MAGLKLIKQFLRKLLGFLPLFGIGVSLLMLLHSLWQLDLIAVRPIWHTGEWIPWFLSTGYTKFCDMPFQCGFWFRTNVGMAYDYYLSLIAISWFVLLASMYFWHRGKVKKLKKEIRDMHMEMIEEYPD